MRRSVLAAAIILASTSLTGTAFADPLPDPILNPSFETAFDKNGGGVGNWTIGADFAGQLNPIGGLSATDGAFFAFVNGPNQNSLGGGFIYQRIGSPGSLQAGTYTFTIDIGLRNDVPPSMYDVAFYAINLDSDPNTAGNQEANDATLARVTDLKAIAGWETKQFQFTLTGVESYFATDVIQITLGTPNGVQINYDNVRGDFTPVPEPSVVLLGCVGLAALAFRRKPRRLVA